MCCGNNRAQYRGTTANLPPPNLAPRGADTRPSMARLSGATFEYIGRTGLTVTGAVTGRRYRFDQPGSRLGVDPRDRPSMATIPVLRQV
jgi:hypothetical protein